MATKKALPLAFLAKKKGASSMENKEEKTGKDLDHDGERGEPASHKKAILATDKKKGLPPAFVSGTKGKHVSPSSSPQAGKAPSVKKKGR